MCILFYENESNVDTRYCLDGFLFVVQWSKGFNHEVVGFKIFLQFDY